MNDDRINELWPDQEARASRNIALHTRLDDFLADYRTSDGQGGGWPIVPSEDVSELRAIIGEIIDLKFERDCDGDRAIQHVASSRTKYTMHAFFEAKAPDFASSDEEWNAYVGDQLQMISNMSSHAGTIATMLGSYTRQRNEQKAWEAAHEADMANFAALIQTADFATGREEYERLSRLYPNDKKLFPTFSRHYITAGMITDRQELLEEIPVANLSTLVTLRPRVVAIVNEYGKFLTASVWRRYNERLFVLMSADASHGDLDTRPVQPSRNEKVV